MKAEWGGVTWGPPEPSSPTLNSSAFAPQGGGGVFGSSCLTTETSQRMGVARGPFTVAETAGAGRRGIFSTGTAFRPEQLSAAVAPLKGGPGPLRPHPKNAQQGSYNALSLVAGSSCCSNSYSSSCSCSSSSSRSVLRRAWQNSSTRTAAAETTGTHTNSARKGMIRSASFCCSGMKQQQQHGDAHPRGKLSPEKRCRARVGPGETDLQCRGTRDLHKLQGSMACQGPRATVEERGPSIPSAFYGAPRLQTLEHSVPTRDAACSWEGAVAANGTLASPSSPFAAASAAGVQSDLKKALLRVRAQHERLQ